VAYRALRLEAHIDRFDRFIRAWLRTMRVGDLSQ
jgi:hypothetical protein